MASFIFVHGSWHWGGCFQKVANALALRGHAVALPDLATHGYDATPVGTVADMAQYTMPVRRLLEMSAMPAILVGHSMGGATCDYLGEAIPERIGALVYLAAFMCPSGVRPDDYNFSETNKGVPLAALVGRDARGIRLSVDDPGKLKAAFYADCSDHDVAIALRNLIPITPAAPNTTRSAITAARFGRLRRIYVECTDDRAITLATQRKMQHDVPGAEVLSMAASHSPFFSQPEQLAGLLHGLV